MSLVESGSFNGDTKDLFERMEKHLKLSKSCGYGRGCWPDVVVKFLDGADWVNIDSYLSGYYKAVLSNGSSLQLFANPANDTIEFRVDVNGFAGPNTMGKDVFHYHVRDNILRPSGYQGAVDEFETHCNLASNVSYNGLACTAWVIQNKNMDYLRCNDLSWNGKHKCSD